MHLSDEELLELSVYDLCQNEKWELLTPLLDELHHFHKGHCEKYNATQQLGETPLAVRAFKNQLLSSIDADKVHRILKSSGTTGTQSQIVLDSDTARLQSKVLSKIMQHWLGPKRLPLLILDSRKALDVHSGMSARAAGIQGMSFFGRDHHFALDENMDLDLAAMMSFADKYAGQPVFMYGFTFIIWQRIVQQLRQLEKQVAFSDAFLLHGGGWKKISEQAVDKKTFKQELSACFGNVTVHDYYGMVEQTGTIYVECEHGMLHAPVWSDINVVDPVTLRPLPAHTVGVVQLQSVIARSYPGHNLLTEDLAIIHGIDDCACGRKGKYFTIQGRVAQAEVRGCSDTFK